MTLTTDFHTVPAQSTVRPSRRRVLRPRFVGDLLVCADGVRMIGLPGGVWTWEHYRWSSLSPAKVARLYGPVHYLHEDTAGALAALTKRLNAALAAAAVAA